MKEKKRFIFILILICTVLVIPPGIWAADQSEGFILSDSKGNVLASGNKDLQYIPASILKILTSFAALRTLKEDYRFQTRYYFDPVSRDLYIKGFGDPLLISEVIDGYSRQIIQKLKTKSIRHIICDNSYFKNKIPVPGKGYSLNPYDSPVGAFCVNFNTVNFKWDAEARKFISAEPQTPLLDFVLDRIKNTRLKSGRIVLSYDESMVYPGLLFEHFLKKNGMAVSGRVFQGKLPGNKEDVQTLFSPFSMFEIIQKLLKYSNNFIANQLLISLGAQAYGPPGDINKGVNILNQVAQKNLGLTDFTIQEGSGLSRNNRITPEQMLTVLQAFQDYHNLMNKQGNDFYKTGTLTGIQTRAGYLSGKKGALYPYVIMTRSSNNRVQKIKNQFNKIIETKEEFSQP